MSRAPWILVLPLIAVVAILVIAGTWHRLRAGADRQHPIRSGWSVVSAVFGFFVVGLAFLMFAYHPLERRASESYRLDVQDPARVWDDQERAIVRRERESEPAWLRQTRPGRTSGGMTVRLAGHYCQLSYSLPLLGPAGWLRGLSPRLAESREAALDLARDSAAEQLRGLVLFNFLKRNPEAAISFPEARKRAARLVTRERIESRELNQYVEEVDLAGKARFRSAVLVQADQATLDRLTDEFIEALPSGDEELAADEAATEREPEDPLSRLAQALGLVVIAFLIATFFNASRAGRLAWPLRITSFAILSAIYVVLVYFRGWD